MYRKAILLFPALLALPLMSEAHDGHGHFLGHQVEHYLSSPGHAIPLLLVTVFFIILAANRKRILAWVRR